MVIMGNTVQYRQLDWCETKLRHVCFFLKTRRILHPKALPIFTGKAPTHASSNGLDKENKNLAGLTRIEEGFGLFERGLAALFERCRTISKFLFLLLESGNLGLPETTLLGKL